MGNFKIEIEATGGHGVDRGKKAGDKVNHYAEGSRSPDAIAKRCLEDLQSLGCNVISAKLIHWPKSESEVVDDLVTGIRNKDL